MCRWRAFGQSCWRRIRDTWKLRHHTSSTEQNYFVFYHWLKSWTSVSQMNYRTPEDARVKTRSAILSSRKIIVTIAFCCVGVFYHSKQRFSLIIVHLCVTECKGHSRVPAFVKILAASCNEICLRHNWTNFVCGSFSLSPGFIWCQRSSVLQVTVQGEHLIRLKFSYGFAFTTLCEISS